MVEVSQVTRRFGGVTALQSVSLSINEGEIFGLLGPNGAGKTTLLNLLTGQLAANAGTLRVDGRDVARETLAVRGMIGIVPQELAIYSDVTARENVSFFGRLYGLWGGELKDAVAQALHFVGLQDVAGRLVKTFSGGMKRRLNIACGIVHAPRLVLLDEPTVGIDPQSRDHILRSVQRLTAQGSTVVYTSHYMEEVERICSHIVILDHGKVIADGSLYDLRSLVNDEARVVVSLKEPVAIDTTGIEAIAGVRQVVQRDYQVTIHSDIDAYNIDSIIQHFTSRGIVIRGVSMEEPSLESVFLSLTGRSLRDGEI